MIISKIDISKPKRSKIKKPSRSMASYDKDYFSLALIESSHILNNFTTIDDVDEQVNILNTVFNSCFDQVAPTTTKYIYRPPAPWIKRELKDKMKYRDTLQGELKLDRQNIQLYN